MSDRMTGAPPAPAPGGRIAPGRDAPAGPVQAAANAVICDDVTYRFGEHVAVNHVSLAILPGETFGLLGPNGAGKTTTIRMLTTLLRPAGGRITVFGLDTSAEAMRVRRMIGYVPQLLSADASLTGRENVELFARLFDVPRRGRAERVDEALEAMGLTEPAAPGEDLLGRHGAPPRTGPGTGQRARACWCWTSPP